MGEYGTVGRLYFLAKTLQFKICVRGTSRLLRSCLLEDCCVFAHRVIKMPSRRMRGNVRVCPVLAQQVSRCVFIAVWTFLSLASEPL